MSNFLKSMFSGLIRAAAMGIVRHLVTAAGAALLALLAAHHLGGGLAQILVGDLKEAALAAAGLGLVAGGIGASVKDVRTVNAKMTVAAASGFDQGVAQGGAAQLNADQSKADAVAAAMKDADKATPKTKADLLAALAGGQ